VINKLLRRFRTVFFFLCDTFFVLVSAKKMGETELVIIRVDNIGDFVLWLPSVRHLLENYPSYRSAALICNQTCVDFAKATGLFSQVIGIDLRRFVRDLGYRLRLIRQVVQLGAEIAIQPTYSRVFLTGDSLIRASHAKQRIGLQHFFVNHVDAELLEHEYQFLLSGADNYAERFKAIKEKAYVDYMRALEVL